MSPRDYNTQSVPGTFVVPWDGSDEHDGVTAASSREAGGAAEEVRGSSVPGVGAQLLPHGGQAAGGSGGGDAGVGVEEGPPVDQGLVEVAQAQAGFSEAGAGENGGAVFGRSAGA